MTDRPIIFSGPEAARFMALVSIDEPSGCWLWTGRLNQNGYGRFGRGEMAHRTSLRLAMRPVPEGLEVDHLCRVRRCVNPDHLEAVSHRENLLRGSTLASAAAALTHCTKGHPLSGENLAVSRGKRRCKTCDRERAAGAYTPTTDRRRRPHLTPTEIDRIMALIAEGWSHSRIATEMAVSIATVSNVRNRGKR